MIGPLIVSVPLGGVVIYGMLAFRHSRIVGVALASVALFAILLAWAPPVSQALAAALGFSGSEAVLLTPWILIGFLMLLDVHLKLRRQVRMITLLTRQIALASKQLNPDTAVVAARVEPTERYVEPVVIVTARPSAPIRTVVKKLGRRAGRVVPETTLNRP